MQADFQYRGANLATLSMPLGGIGTGCVGLAGNGHLVDWEIFNRPNKQSLNGFTHLAGKAEGKSGLLDARVLQGPPPAPYTGAGDGVFSGFGFGPSRYTLGGAPCFSSNEMEVGFPLACIRFQDTGFPGRAAFSAFNPFIPREDRDSSFPAAFFQVELTNTTDEPLRYTVAFTLANPHDGGHDHQCGQEEGLSYCLLGRQRRTKPTPRTARWRWPPTRRRAAGSPTGTGENGSMGSICSGTILPGRAPCRSEAIRPAEKARMRRC